MKLLLVISSLSSGGAERVMSDIANYWATRGSEIILLTFSGVDFPDFYPLDSRITRLHLDMRKTTKGLLDKLVFNLRRLYSLRKIMKEIAPDAVISFMDTTNVITVGAGWGLRTRVIVSERNSPQANPMTNMFWRIGRIFFYRHATVVVAQTRKVANWIEHKCGAEVVTIPNPLRKLPVPSKCRENLFVAVGSLHAQKGFDLLLSAFSVVIKDFPDWRLVILGEGRERATLESLVDELGIGEYVSLPGRVSNVEEWLERASIMVQPSRYEGFPNVVLEGMGMGLAVIAADCDSGPSDIIENLINGILVPVEDLEALAYAMRTLLVDRALRESLAKRAVEVREVFSQERIMPQWESILLPQR